MDNQIGQLFKLRFQLPQQGVVRLDLPVQLAAVGEDAAPLQRLSRHALVNGGPFLQPPRRMAAVVDALRMTGQLQAAVRRCGPHLPPNKQMFLAVPSRRDGILPPILCTFRILADPFVSALLGLGRGHVDFLFVHLILVLLLPALGLRRLKLSGGEAPFLAALHTEILFLCLVLPRARLRQRAYRQQDVGMGIVAVGVVDGNVGAHPLRHELLPDKLLQECNLLLA